jgi:hypothetical protein
LYSKWNVSEVFEGTGKKPRDVPPNLSFAELITIVQQRANAKADPATGERTMT